MEKRLQSLKLPRDLTLGGTKPKKAYTPNLNVARNKEKAKELLKKFEEKSKNNQNKREKNNHKFDRADRFVQSSGIFSEGVGSDAIRKTRYERASSSRDETPSVMPMPKVKKDEWQVDNKTENKVYDDLMGCDDISDDDEKLPFAPLSWNEGDLKENKVPVSVKLEVKVEPDETNNLELNRLKIDMDRVTTEFQENSAVSDYNPVLTLWSMPDSFAGKGLSDDPNITKLFDYKLGDMLEGQIGKMKIRKSGKIEVFIGCVKYNLETTDLETFSEKLIEIDIKENNQSTSAVLGEVQNRFILNPDWEFLLKDS